MKRPNKGIVTVGTRIDSIPKAHLQPGPFKKAAEIGPPSQAVMMAGEPQIDWIRPRYRREVVSAIKTLRLYPMPLIPTV
jgi:hypothetical protein